MDPLRGPGQQDTQNASYVQSKSTEKISDGKHRIETGKGEELKIATEKQVALMKVSVDESSPNAPHQYAPLSKEEGILLDPFAKEMSQWVRVAGQESTNPGVEVNVPPSVTGATPSIVEPAPGWYEQFLDAMPAWIREMVVNSPIKQVRQDCGDLPAVRVLTQSLGTSAKALVDFQAAYENENIRPLIQGFLKSPTENNYEKLTDACTSKQLSTYELLQTFKEIKNDAIGSMERQSLIKQFHELSNTTQTKNDALEKKLEQNPAFFREFSSFIDLAIKTETAQRKNERKLLEGEEVSVTDYTEASRKKIELEDSLDQARDKLAAMCIEVDYDDVVGILGDITNNVLNPLHKDIAQVLGKDEVLPETLMAKLAFTSSDLDLKKKYAEFLQLAIQVKQSYEKGEKPDQANAEKLEKLKNELNAMEPQEGRDRLAITIYEKCVKTSFKEPNRSGPFS